MRIHNIYNDEIHNKEDCRVLAKITDDDVVLQYAKVNEQK